MATLLTFMTDKQIKQHARKSEKQFNKIMAARDKREAERRNAEWERKVAERMAAEVGLIESV